MLPCSEIQKAPLDLLNQPYDFLGKGAQFYAFGSRDGRFVLKLFKTHHGFITSQAKREKRLTRLFASAQLATNKLSSETAIIALHLQATQEQLGHITLYDRLHIAHSLNLDETAFLIQKRAQPAQDKLSDLLEAGRFKEAKTAMQALLAVAERPSRLGIKNKDIHLIRNCGFIGDEAIILDTGSLSMRKKTHLLAPAKVRQKAALQLRHWLQSHYPQHQGLFDEV
jgi:hypothetical protein